MNVRDGPPPPFPDARPAVITNLMAQCGITQAEAAELTDAVGRMLQDDPHVCGLDGKRLSNLLTRHAVEHYTRPPSAPAKPWPLWSWGWNRRITIHHPELVIHIRRRARAHVDAEDVAQTTWITLQDNDREGRFPRVVMPGLARTQARYHWLSARRARARRLETPIEVVPEPRDDRPTPESSAAFREELAAVRTCVANMPLWMQQVFDQFYGPPARGRHMTYRLAANELGCSIDHVRSTLRDIRRTLRADRDRRGAPT